jgi:undecaprenyl-diphosphatase
MVTFPAPLQALDLAGLRFTRTLGHTPALERVVRAYSQLGQYSACWLGIGAAGTLLDRRRRGRWARALAGVALSYAANQTIKFAVRRPRPLLEDLPQLMHTPTQLSFPSAHATSSFAAAQAYAGLLPAAPLKLAAFAMAGSRLYLGVHWPSDIVIGAALGTAIGKGART